MAPTATKSKTTTKRKTEDKSTSVKKAKVTFASPIQKTKEKTKATTATSTSEKSTAKKPKVLAPAPEFDDEDEDEDEVEKKPQPKKSALKTKTTTKTATKIKALPTLISENANAKLKAKKEKKNVDKKQKAKSPSPMAEDDNDEEEDDEDEDKENKPEEEKNMNVDNEEDEEENSEDDHLHGFSSEDDDDSSDEEINADEVGLSPYEISKLPTVAKDDESVKRKLEKAKRTPTEDRGVIYIGRLPHGFYEEQLRAYFTQFGEITRLRVSRNKKTGKCKHYGFIEFDSSSVAQIVAETMDNYLLTGHILKCKVIPKEEVHPELWVGANRKWRVVPRDRMFRVQHNKERTEEEKAKVNKRLLKRQNERKRKLETMGIDYDFDAVSYKKTKADVKV